MANQHPFWRSSSVIVSTITGTTTTGKDPNTEPLRHVRFRAWETSEKSLPFSVDGIITDHEPRISGDDAVIVKIDNQQYHRTGKSP